MNAADLLERYAVDGLPEFDEIALESIETVGNFGNRPLHVAAVRGKIPEVVALLDAGAEVNARGEDGNTPLHDATGQGHYEVVDLLLEHGADPELCNDDGKRPFDLAVLLGHEIIRSRLERGGLGQEGKEGKEG